MTQPIVSFENVSKKFALIREGKPRSWLETLQALLSKKRLKGGSEEDFWVLRDISFDIQRGETFAMIGSNGAGKSTMLKLIAQIIRPTHGTIRVRGRISALLELGAGFHNDLTGRENIYLSSTLAGLTRADVDHSIDEIIDFAGIGPFIDVPVRHYSSGMFVRLGFSLATHINPDILVVDEVLAVGDDSFQKKCLEKIHEIRRRGTTVIVVSHDMSVIGSLSDRAMWLQDGTIKKLGPTVEVIRTYLMEQRRIYDSESQNVARVTDGNKTAEIDRVEFVNGQGQPTTVLETGKRAAIRIYYTARQRIDKPIFGLSIYGGNGVHVNGPNTKTADFPIDWIEGAGMVEYHIDFLPLLGGNYSISVGIFDDTASMAYDYFERAINFVVEQHDSKELYGLVYIPATWEHVRQEVLVAA